MASLSILVFTVFASTVKILAVIIGSLGLGSPLKSSQGHVSQSILQNLSPLRNVPNSYQLSAVQITLKGFPWSTFTTLGLAFLTLKAMADVPNNSIKLRPYNILIIYDGVLIISVFKVIVVSHVKVNDCLHQYVCVIQSWTGFGSECILWIDKLRVISHFKRPQRRPSDRVCNWLIHPPPPDDGQVVRWTSGDSNKDWNI